MTTELVILRWQAEGLRCPDHEIRLADAEGRPTPITLIQMPNGTGKTTTLKLLRAALSGEAIEWSSHEVRSIQKRGGDAETGFFLLECICDQRRLTIVIQLDFEEGTARYVTTYGSGMKAGFHPPAALRRFLKKDFVRLFVFDGEQAEYLLDRNHTNAHDAIDSLFQLKYFEGMRNRVNEYWDSHMSAAKASDQKGLSRRRNRVYSLKQRLMECGSAYGAAQQERDRLVGQLEGLKRKFRDELASHKEYADRLRAADEAFGDAKSRVQAQAAEIHARMRDPHALSATVAVQIAELRANLDRVKLPESTAREFFEELAQEDECVCGRPLDQACRDHIRQQAARYLGSDDVSLLNAMKGDIGSLVGLDPQQHAAQLDVQLQGLKEAIRSENEARTARDAIETKAVSAAPELEKINADISELQGAVDAAVRLVEKFQDPTDTLTDEQTFGISVLERRLRDAERKLAEITQTLALRAKRNALDAILRDAHVLARSSIGRATVQQANERIADLMPSNAIRINGIENCLVLEGQEGGSMGETLSVAYAFLATFFNSASHRFPFIVDSPAGSVDLEIRPRIADLVPGLTGQFVAFTISSERQSFCDRLQGLGDHRVRSLTLFRKDGSSLERMAQSVPGFQETSDGLVVPGAEFFNRFQLESE